jgi:hypothetical protein
MFLLSSCILDIGGFVMMVVLASGGAVSAHSNSTKNMLKLDKNR